jgi:hypothetical protein
MSLGFQIMSSVQDLLDPKSYAGGPWVHLATVSRHIPGGQMKEYVAFKKLFSMDTWIEEIDTHGPCFSKKIENEAEWSDLVAFLKSAKLLEISSATETRLGRRLAKLMERPGVYA